MLRVVRSWQRPGDAGVVATSDAGEAVGACWSRILTRDQAAHASVGAGVPELTLGVKPAWRAQGVGRSLLAAACDRARDAGHRRIGLRVDRRDVAHRLHRTVGFAVVSSVGDQDVMVRTLR